MNSKQKEVIGRMVRKAERALKAAKQHVKNDDYDFASSKAYYAVFHLMQAVLLTKELTFSKHSAVIAEFNRNFIKAGIFSKDFSKNIERLFKERQMGDYDYFPSIDKEDAERDIEIAQIICEKIKKYLQGENGNNVNGSL